MEFTFPSIARQETPTGRNVARDTIQEPIHASTVDAQTPNFWEKMVAHRIGATKNTTRHDLQQLFKTI